MLIFFQIGIEKQTRCAPVYAKQNVRVRGFAVTMQQGKETPTQFNDQNLCRMLLPFVTKADPAV
jgi:hypothetical protein